MSAASSDISPIDLPVINMSWARMNNTKSRMEEAQKLIDCFSGVGFCVVTGLDGYDMDRLFKWIKW